MGRSDWRPRWAPTACEPVLSPHLQSGASHPQGSRRHLRRGRAARRPTGRRTHRRLGPLGTPRRLRRPLVARPQRGWSDLALGRRSRLRCAARALVARRREVRAGRGGESCRVRLARRSVRQRGPQSCRFVAPGAALARAADLAARFAPAASASVTHPDHDRQIDYVEFAATDLAATQQFDELAVRSATERAPRFAGRALV